MPGITASFAEDHKEDDALTKEIKQLSARIRTSNGAQRVELGMEVHERFKAYVGIYLGPRIVLFHSSPTIPSKLLPSSTRMILYAQWG